MVMQRDSVVNEVDNQDPRQHVIMEHGMKQRWLEHRLEVSQTRDGSRGGNHLIGWKKPRVGEQQIKWTQTLMFITYSMEVWY